MATSIYNMKYGLNLDMSVCSDTFKNNWEKLQYHLKMGDRADIDVIDKGIRHMLTNLEKKGKEHMIHYLLQGTYEEAERAKEEATYSNSMDNTLQDFSFYASLTFLSIVINDTQMACLLYLKTNELSYETKFIFAKNA